MYKDLQQLLFPASELSLGIVVAIGVAFVAWTVSCIVSFFRARKFERECIRLRDEVSRWSSADEETEDALSTVRAIVKKTGLRFDSPIVILVKSLAGIGDDRQTSRFDVLEASAIRRSVPSYRTLRSTVGLFLVAGLFGTLIGLAKALPGLSLLASNGADTSTALSALFSNLSGAFAPSVWGVFCTLVASVFLAFLHRKMMSFVEELREASALVWIPAYCPTLPQKVIQTLAETARNTENTLRTAENFAQLARQLELDYDDLESKLTKTGKSLDEIEAAGSNLGVVAQAYSAATAEVSNSQNSLAQSLSGLDTTIREYDKRLEHREAASMLTATKVEHTIGKLEAVLVELATRDTKSKEAIESAANLVAELANATKSAQTDMVLFGQKTAAELVSPLRSSIDEQAVGIAGQLSGLKEAIGGIHVPLSSAQEAIVEANSYNRRSLEELIERLARNGLDLNSETVELKQELKNQSAALTGATKKLAEALDRHATVQLKFSESEEKLSLQTATIEKATRDLERLNHRIGVPNERSGFWKRFGLRFRSRRN